MNDLLKASLLAIALCVSVLPGLVVGGDMTRDRIKGLDEQVQDIKQDVLAISTELLQLEETLIFPSSTQVSLFVSLAEGSRIQLDAMDVRLNGQDVTHHVYTHREVEALRRGGVQRIYTGNLRSGEQELEVTVRGPDGLHERASHRFSKGAGPALVEVVLSGGSAPVHFIDR
ncbi:hypothetical protein [Isoalcanivorax indicus]|uniref:hypothetical protein n=1 Tax=Isoalcanivorax indicus TaxID=2202653 RepID=UPI000DBA0A07|nr:hypothetical protein [Isoalcanivorax indicus]